jgi:hypothetical protein
MFNHASSAIPKAAIEEDCYRAQHAQFEQLEAIAASLGVPAEELTQAAVTDLIGEGSRRTNPMR